jgi:hypothetical protein
MLLAVNDPSPVRGVGADHAVDLAPDERRQRPKAAPIAPIVMTLPNDPGTNSCNLDRTPLARRDSTSFCPAGNPDDRGTDESTSLKWMSG